MNYDLEEFKIKLLYDPKIHLVKFVTMIQLEYVYGNVVHVCCTSSKYIFDANMSKLLPLTKTLFKIIFVHYDKGNIKKISVGF